MLAVKNVGKFGDISNHCNNNKLFPLAVYYMFSSMKSRLCCALAINVYCRVESVYM